LRKIFLGGIHANQVGLSKFYIHLSRGKALDYFVKFFAILLL